MSDNNLGAAARFGTEVQKQLSEDQRRANSSENGIVNKCTIVVLTTLDANNKFSFMSAEEQLREQNVVGKVIDRLPNLLGRATNENLSDQNGAYYILHPNNGVPTRIDERIRVGEGTAVIVSYTVNKTVSEMYGLLSMAMFSAGVVDLTDFAAEFGIHAIVVVEENKAHDFIAGLSAQVSALQTVNLTSIDDTEGSFDKAVIEYDKLPGNPTTVLSGAVRTFIMQTTSGEVVAAIPNNGELNVNQKHTAAPVDLEEDFDQDEEVVDQDEAGEEAPTGSDLFGYKAESLTLPQLREALEAINYDLSEMDEAAIREAFETEQSMWLERGEEGAEDNSEEEEETEEEEDSEEFDAVQYLASALAAAQLDRTGLKVLVRAQDMKVMKSDTEESLTAKLLELVEGSTEEEMLQLIQDSVNALEERGIQSSELLALISPDEEYEEEDEDLDEEDGEEEEEDLDDDGEAEEDGEEESVRDLIAAVTDPLDYFQFSGGDLTADERTAAVVAMGENVTGLNIIQVMKLFQRIQAQTVELDPTLAAEQEEEEEDSSEEAVRELLGQYEDPTVQDVAENIGILVDECETVDEMIDAILAGGSEDDYASVEAMAELHGVETDLDIGEMEWADALLLVLPAFLGAGLNDASEEEDEDEDEEDGDVPESVSNSNLKFLKAVDNKNPIGPLLSVDTDQSLVINFTLTDGNTYREIESELADVNGFNYRFPFNLGKSGKAQGSMHVPAQNLLTMMERAGTSRFLADPNTFDVAAWAQSLEDSLNNEINVTLYADRIEDGADPYEAGVVVGDFIDDEEMEEMSEMGIDSEDFDDLRGDHLPIASLYNARSRVCPVTVDDAYVVLNTTVLNVAVPGFWGVQARADIEKMIQACVNRVIALAEDAAPGLKVYAGFTLESAALLNNDSLFHALATVRSMSGIQSYSASDVANFEQSEDMIETASALDARDLPFGILAGGLADATFENGGDLTVLVPCNFETEEEDEDEDEDGDDE